MTSFFKKKVNVKQKKLAHQAVRRQDEVRLDSNKRSIVNRTMNPLIANF